MKQISFVVPNAYRNNKIFDLNDPYYNRDNCLAPYVLMKEKFKELGYEIATSDLASPNEADIVLYNEMPTKVDTDREKSFLLIFESELVRPDNWDLSKHKSFNKIFTWNDQFIDNQKYIKFNFPNNFSVPKIGLEGRKKLAILISGNKTSHHQLELYSKRLETIKWFERNHPEDFEYYGFGWDKYNFGSQIIGKVLDKIGAYRLLPKRQTICYRGIVDSKNKTLMSAKFCICYENARDIPGYITEKIFDCFFAGTVPVYWGPNNITEHIPKDCYISRTDFSTHEKLYQHLKNLNNEDYLNYQKAIISFLNTDKAKEFSANHFAKTITRYVASE